MFKKRFYLELNGDVKCFYRRHIDFPLLTVVVISLIIASAFSLFLLFFVDYEIVVFTIACLIVGLLVLLKGEFILFAEINHNRELILHDFDLEGGKLSLQIDSIKSITIDTRNTFYSKKYAYMVTYGKTMPNKSQMYITLQDDSLIVFGSKSHGGQLIHLKNFINHEIYQQPHVFVDPATQKKGIEWMRLAKEYIVGQWQIILNNSLILLAMTLLGWNFQNFITIQFLDILILAIISVFYNIVIQNRMSLLASFAFKSVSTTMTFASLIGFSLTMFTLLSHVYFKFLKIGKPIPYLDTIDFTVVLVGLSFFMSRAYLFLKGFMQNNHYKEFTSIHILHFFIGKVMAIMAWGVLAAAFGMLMKDFNSKSSVLFIVGCIGIKALVEMTHMFVLRKVSPKLVGILYPIRNL